MANEQHVALLKQGEFAFRGWLEKQNGKISFDLSNADLRGIDLSYVDFSYADFRGANLSQSNLYHCNFYGADFTRTLINETNVTSSDFRNTKLYGTSFSRSDLTRTDFRGARFHVVELIDAELEEACLAGVNLEATNITGANLTMADIRDVNVGAIIWDRLQMRGKYRGIRGIDSCYGNSIFKRCASDQDFLDSLEEKMRTDRIYFLFFIWGLIDYGRSIGAVFLYLACMIIGFSLIYTIFPFLLVYSSGEQNAFSPYYFSIVTFTTLGFGDVRPACLSGEVVVCFEVVSGYVGLGLLLSVLADKVARRS